MHSAARNLERLAYVFQQADRYTERATDHTLQFVEVAGTTGARSQFLPPGVKSGLYGQIASHNDFEINLEPPEIKTLDAQDQSDTLMEIEEVNP